MRSRPQRRRAGRLAIAALAASLGGCSDNPEATKTLGSAIGAAVGAVVGSQIGSGSGQAAATTIGAALGAFFGGEVLLRLTEGEQRAAAEAQQRALETTPSGEPVTWTDPDTGTTGRVVAQPAFRANDSAPCREFRHVIDVQGSGEKIETDGVACRNADGAWRLVEQD